MKTTLRLIYLAAIIILSVTALIAQTKDVVHLKNGSVIKGSILEMIPEKTIKIQTTDGNIFVYNMSEVEKISKEAVAAPSNESKPMVSPSNNESQRTYDNQRGYENPRSSEGAGTKFSIFGGVALPLGDFAKKEGPYGEKDSANVGLAKLGWTAGAQLVTGGTIGFIIEGSYSQNKLEYPTVGIPAGTLSTTSWTSILALAGIKIGTDNSSGTNFFIAPLAGALFLKNPEISFTPAGSTITQTSSSHSAIGFAYGANVELIIAEHITLSGKYIASKPKFKWSETYYGQSYDYEFDQSVSLLLISLGIAF